MEMRTRIDRYADSELKNKHIIHKPWFIFRFEILLVVILAFVVALLNQIPNWVVDNNTDDIISKYPLRDNMLYSSFVMFFTIAAAIFIGVFTEMNGFAGSYGSTIFVLVPSFVWLFADRAGATISGNEHEIRDVLYMSRDISTIIFYTSIGVTGVLLLAHPIFLLIIGNATKNRTKATADLMYNYVKKMLVVSVNVMVVLMLGVALVNYAVFSLHLADIPPEEQISNEIYDFYSANMTFFIGLIAIIFAVLMIAIGLSKTFASDIKYDPNEDKSEVWIKKQKKLKQIEKEIKLAKKGAYDPDKLTDMMSRVEQEIQQKQKDIEEAARKAKEEEENLKRKAEEEKANEVEKLRQEIELLEKNLKDKKGDT